MQHVARVWADLVPVALAGLPVVGLHFVLVGDGLGQHSDPFVCVGVVDEDQGLSYMLLTVHVNPQKNVRPHLAV